MHCRPVHGHSPGIVCFLLESKIFCCGQLLVQVVPNKDGIGTRHVLLLGINVLHKMLLLAAVDVHMRQEFSKNWKPRYGSGCLYQTSTNLDADLQRLQLASHLSLTAAQPL